MMGARSSGLATTSSCLSDEWSLFNNVAGLASLEKAKASFSYDVQPGFKPFNKMGAVFALGFKPGVAAIGLFRFGDELYSEQIISIGFANTFGLASIGLKLNYIQYKATGFGTRGVLSASFGGIAKLTKTISVGAHIINVNQPDISKVEKEKIPTILVLGIAAQLTPQTLFTTELEKDLSHPVKWKTGVEYKPFRKFAARTGFNINPNTVFFGFGFFPGRLSVDYACQHNFTIGPRHQATVGYIFNRQK
jgi:hypothetical protein